MAGEVETLAARFARRLKKDQLVVTVAESCTGGLLASTLTDISGASKWFKQAWVVYSNEVKSKLLGVDADLLAEKGAVNEEVAEQLANGALERANADISIAITGIAGPKSDDSVKEVGLVYVSISDKETNQNWTDEAIFSGGRHENKLAFVIFALRMVLDIMDSKKDDEPSEISEDEVEEDDEDMIIVDSEERIEGVANVDDPWGGNLGPDWKEKIEDGDEVKESTQPSINTDEVEWESSG